MFVNGPTPYTNSCKCDLICVLLMFEILKITPQVRQELTFKSAIGFVFSETILKITFTELYIYIYAHILKGMHHHLFSLLLDGYVALLFLMMFTFQI